MASKIKVDQIQTADGSGTIALQNQLSGMTTASLPTITTDKLGAGAVLQVVVGSNTNTANGGFLLSTNSSSFQSVPLTATITPKATANKILISVNTSFYRAGSADFTIYAGSTNIGHSSNGIMRLTGADNNWTDASHQILHSPNTTSAVTYQLYARSESGDLTVGGDGSVQNTIVLMEIKT